MSGRHENLGETHTRKHALDLPVSDRIQEAGCYFSARPASLKQVDEDIAIDRDAAV